MNEISALPANIRDWLSQREELAGIIFLTEYPPVKKAVPLRRITVAVGIAGMETVDYFEASETDPPDESEYCRQARIKLRFSIHVPYTMGGEACHSAFADIIDCLIFDSGLNIESAGCERITEDRNTDAFVLAAYALVKADICPAQSSSNQFPSFLDKTLLCGSHIRDGSLHLNDARRAFLAEPLVTGTYTGTGSASRSINLGFAPAAVAVFAGGFPALTPSGSGYKAYAAFAAGSTGTLGASLTADGFRVTNGSSQEVLSVSPALNESGITYTYAALRPGENS